MNIDSFFDRFIIMVVGGARDFYNLLDSITFRGISLLDYIITIFLLGIVIPLVMTLLKSRRVGGHNQSYKEQKREQKEGSDDD